MKGEKRAAYAMLDSDIERVQRSAWRFGTVKKCSRLARKSGRRGARGGIVFFDLAVSASVIRKFTGLGRARGLSTATRLLSSIERRPIIGM